MEKQWPAPLQAIRTLKFWSEIRLRQVGQQLVVIVIN